jgi:hypothetical protein
MESEAVTGRVRRTKDWARQVCLETQALIDTVELVCHEAAVSIERARLSPEEAERAGSRRRDVAD